VDGLSTGGQCLLEDVEIARKLRLRTVVAFQSEGAVQAVLCSAPNVPEWNFLYTATAPACHVIRLKSTEFIS